MILAIAIASVYIFSSPAPETPLGITYLLTNWVSHIGFLTFFGFIILILPLCYLVPNARTVKVVSAILAAVALAMLGFDALLYNKYGVHLSFSTAEMLRSEANTSMSLFGWQRWAFFFLIFIFWLSAQLVIANALWKRVARLQKRKLALPISSFFVVCFVSSHALHIWADANLYHPIVQQDDLFPLSYPATAKTLMSRYDLLDRDNYEQRLELQFDDRISQINYPLSPLYCSVSAQKKVLLLVNTDTQARTLETSLSHSIPLYADQSSASDSQRSYLFGLPELYHSALSKKTPILLELPAALGLQVGIFANELEAGKQTQKFSQQWSDFEQGVTSAKTNLAIGFVSNEQLSDILATSQVMQDYQVLAVNKTEAGEYALYSTNTLFADFASSEDLAPTILNLLGCNAPTQNYSTGRDLSKPGRDWLVTTQERMVIVMQDDKRIEVSSNGNSKVYNLLTAKELPDDADTRLLSQAIKRLSSFAAPR
jgi:membrane-anchored protein YejM (alkaline phosphatase superfamily)